MGAETEGVSVIELRASEASKPTFDQLRPPDLVSIHFTHSRLNGKAEESQFVPCIRSGSFADIGPRRYMEDEHICIDDLSSHLGSLSDQIPLPSAFYAVFDGHGGPEAAAFMKKHTMRLFFEDFKLPQLSQTESESDEASEEVEECLRRAFESADLALADDPTVSASSGTTALTALLLGRVLVVANAGDCRAVLCRKGEAIEMSQDHRPIHPAERRRVEALGGFVDDGYLNGVVAVSRALGDWDMKFPHGSRSPLVSEPELRRTILSEDDEFLIMGCDGIWDVMSSQHAVSVVKRGLRRHDDPAQCARDLVAEALRLSTFDNLTALVVCFSPKDREASTPPPQHRRLRCCSLSAEALCTLKSLLDGGR